MTTRRQACRGAEVQRCRGATVQRCSGAIVQWCSGAEDCPRGGSPRHTQLVALGQPTASALAHLMVGNLPSWEPAEAVTRSYLGHPELPRWRSRERMGSRQQLSTSWHTNTCSARAPYAPGRAGGSSCAVTASHPLKSSRNACRSAEESGDSSGAPPAAPLLSSSSGSPVPPMPTPMRPSPPLSLVQLGVAPRRSQAGAAGWRAASARQLPHMPVMAWQAARRTDVAPCGPATTSRRTATQAGASNVHRSHSSAAGMTVSEGNPGWALGDG